MVSSTTNIPPLSDTPSATLTETAAPFPPVPANELQNQIANKTILRNPGLFRVVTPIIVDRFQQLLQKHPNQPFVESACVGLRYGFWPYADTSDAQFPVRVDNSRTNRKISDGELEFLRMTRDEEIQLGRYSPSFGSRLFPGMSCHPIFAVPKADSDTFRLVNDHSSGKHYLNSLISPSNTTVRYDCLDDFSKVLRRVRNDNRKAKIWLFKSDVSQAYRRLPVHPLWQIRQVVKIDNEYHVDRCVVFGNRGSRKLWCGFMGLVIWTGIHVRGIKDLLYHIDDAFSYDLTNELVWYEPYKQNYPAKQVRLLRLWDEIGLPHEQKKQEYGYSLEVLGMQVDTDKMTITIPLASKLEIISLVLAFIDPSKPRRRPLEEWRGVLNRIIWGLTVEPLLRPALYSSHSKLSGKTDAKELIEIDDTVVSDLKWLIKMFESSSGIDIMEEKDWRSETADLVMFCDASMHGLGFWSHTDKLGYHTTLPRHQTNHGTHFNELHCIVSALDWASNRQNRRRVLIYTDSMVSVGMFEKMKALPKCNTLLFAAVKILIRSKIALRVVHIPGADNIIADALAHGELNDVHAIHPTLILSTFTPFAYDTRYLT